MELTLKQAAAELGVTDTVLMRMVRDGEIGPCNERPTNRSRYHARFDPAVVAAFKEARRITQPPLPQPVGMATMLTDIAAGQAALARRFTALETAVAELSRILK